MSVMIRMCVLLGALMWHPAGAASVRELVVAAQMDNTPHVQKLLGKGMSPNTIDPVSGESILMLALREDAHGVIAELIAHKEIKLEHQAPNGNTALMMAAFKHNRAAVLALLARGAIVTRPGWTALHYAAASGDVDIAAILLDRHAYIDAESPSGLTPLMIAAREGQPDVVGLLLREGADARLVNNEKLTASQIALRAGHERIAATLDQHLAARGKQTKN
jgi:ankyrin repeat protein